jgi:tRNA (cmo5U34)-methyltransferase
MILNLKMVFLRKEILNKSKSLKGILEPFSTKGNYDLLKRAGFKDIMTIFRWNNFEGIIAIK